MGTGRTLVSSPQVWQLLREASPCWRLKQEPWGGDEVQERGARGFLCPRVAPTPAKGTALGSGSMGHLKLPKPRRSPGVPSCCQQPCTALPWVPWAPSVWLSPDPGICHGQPRLGLGDPVPDLGALVREKRVSGACTRAAEEVGHGLGPAVTAGKLVGSLPALTTSAPEDLPRRGSRLCSIQDRGWGLGLSHLAAGGGTGTRASGGVLAV